MPAPAKISPLFSDPNRPILRDLGDPAGELRDAIRAGFLAELSHLGVLTFEGEDAVSFLQNQLSCDVEAVSSRLASTLGAYCNPKGRMLASFLLWRENDAWRMVLERSLLEQVRKRLSMYVLRAKVRISISADMVLLGVGGPAGKNRLPDAIGSLPVDAHSVLIDDRVSAVGIQGGRCLLMSAPAKAMEIWNALAAQVPASGTLAWEWSDIHGGIPWISSRTEGEFVPQMVNLELLGGVSFKKGCYPGQEIVARTQYLGKTKRRMYLAHTASQADAGVELYSDDVGRQSNGMVVNAVAAPDGGSDLLAVVQRESVEHSRVHLAGPDGPLLEFMPLPYPLG